jgi:1-deoxy-D-xylulose-5-phosphate reductoisomerase
LTRKLTVLGATGSIGASTLAVVEDVNTQALAAGHEPVFAIEALSANTDATAMIALAHRHRPAHVVMADPQAGAEVAAALAGTGITVASGEAAVTEAATRPADIVMAAIVGAAGLEPTLAAARQGIPIALANKECLVCAGPLFLETAAAAGATILPTDSEHNAIFQVLDEPAMVEKLILTASGGPFRTASADTLAHATPEQACAHPNWSMGRKISVDSATLFNKGLELIEAALLFAMPEDRIEVLIHPQSLIHSLVAYRDGTQLAQLGCADMRIPIAHVLAWPSRFATAAPRLDLAAVGTLTFEAPDTQRFPALDLCRAALRRGGAAPTVLSAANEVAVASFLARNVAFPQIAAIVAETLDAAARRGLDGTLSSLDDVQAADAGARALAHEAVSRRSA